jgi:hypothetical protein
MIIFSYNKFKLQDFISFLFVFVNIGFRNINFAVDRVFSLNDIHELAHTPIIDLNLCILCRLFIIILMFVGFNIIEHSVFGLAIYNQTFL